MRNSVADVAGREAATVATERADLRSVRSASASQASAVARTRNAEGISVSEVATRVNSLASPRRPVRKAGFAANEEQKKERFKG